MLSDDQYAVVHEGGTAPYAWAPSDKAIKGRNDQSLSAAGSAPSSVPNHVSISGPLEDLQPSATLCGEGRFTWHGGSRPRKLAVGVTGAKQSSLGIPILDS